MQFRSISWFSCLSLSLLTATSAFAQDIDFNSQVRPIINRHCTACHGGVKQAADLSFVTAEGVLPPDGWVVEPGDPDASVMIERIESDDPDMRMPPPEHGEGLNEDEVQTLRQWIKQGASWQGHWAYEKPLQPEIPEVQQADWPLQGLDNFVLARLEREQIKPSPDASSQRWLRRVTLDLTGLPPTVEQRADFLRDLEANGEQAYRAVVNRLLDSQAFGERWASVWLDQVRYADSKGLGMDGRRNIWKYRDWVIKAFNQDMPYSDFTIKQIAGDLMADATTDDRVATAVHRLTQSNQEGGTDDEEFRVAAVLDRVNTTWQAWQGVTFGCVQCHSHPYDPFKHEEYYQFAAFFNNSRDVDLDDDWPHVQAPLDDADVERATRLDDEIERLKNQIWQQENSLVADSGVWQPISKMEASTNNDTQVVVESKPDHAEYHTVDTVSRGTAISLIAELPESLKKLTAIRFVGLPLNPETALADSEWGFSLSLVEASMIAADGKETTIELKRILIDEPDPYFDPQESLNPKSGRGASAFSRIHHPRTVAFIPVQPVEVPDTGKLKVTLHNNAYALGAFPIVAKRGHLAVSQNDRFSKLLEDESLKQLRQQLSEKRKQRKSIPSTSVPVMAERPDWLARPSYVFNRGSFLTKGDQVTPETPDSLPPLPEGEKIDRLTLAKWMAGPDNPLTARVAVNRVWARLFGVGIVSTEEDFGASGELPSHPELLDFLAVRFQQDLGYRFKSLIREIVLSRTYRQSSVIRPELQQRDAQNRLLARGPRHRLPAEMVRDQALAISGLLTKKLGGPPVHPPIPGGVWRPFVRDDWKTPEIGDPDRYRRSIYTYTKRSIPYPTFASFDSPSRELCAPRRLRSNTPLQALVTLNDQTFAECAEALAQRMAQHSDEIREQLEFGFTRAVCRPPTDDELNQLESLVGQFSEEESTAALQTAARVLLNLDEVLTK